MLGNTLTQNRLTYLFYAVSLLGVSALWYSPAIVSVATLMCIVLSLLRLKFFFKTPFKPVSVVLVVLMLLVLIDGIVSGFQGQASAKFLLILGFVGVFNASYHFGKSDSRTMLIYLLIISSIVALVNMIAVGNYFMHKEYFDTMLLQSKHIPVGMHHIHFGVLNGLLIILLFGSFFVIEKWNRVHKIISTIILYIIFISFHILSSRTGLFSFYGASLVMLVVYAVRKSQYKVIMIGVLTLSVSLGAAYGLSSSFQNKVANSIEDMSSWGKGEEINYKSMGMRIEAARMCVYIIRFNPLGVGATAQDAAMAATYEALDSVLLEENRVGPHNQFLEYGVKYGWFGLLVILSFFFSLFAWAKDSSFSMWGIITLLFIAVFFESLLERQASLYFIALLVPLSYHFFVKKGINDAAEDLI